MRSKSCPDCGETKPLDEFYDSRKGAQGKQTRCKSCHKIFYIQWRDRNPEKGRLFSQRYRAANKPSIRRQRQEHRLRSLYGLTEAQYQAMLTAQGGVCALCGDGPTGMFRLFVDHCHLTNKIRGLLCSRCNSGIGQFRENAEVLAKAITYLKK